MTIRAFELSPRHWALATFFMPVACAIGYCLWLGVSRAGLAESTQAEEIVKTIASLFLSIVFFTIPRPWSRAIAIAFLSAFVLTLIAVLQFEVFRGL
jgi:hypothetical protein